MIPFLDEIASAIRHSKRILCISGAGMSAESGIPTYRGIGGLYNQTLTDEQLPIERVLSGPFFAQNPAITWKYLSQIEEACRGAKPNRAHKILAKWQETKDIWVLTQNVDGFHLEAGSNNVIEIHGNVHRLKCTKCHWNTEVPDYANLDVPPSCPECHHTIRPEVVLFEEMLPEHALHCLFRELEAGFDLVFSVGTSSLFPYITAPVIQMAQRGALTVEINPEPTSISNFVQYAIQAPAGEVFTALDELVT